MTLIVACRAPRFVLSPQCPNDPLPLASHLDNDAGTKRVHNREARDVDVVLMRFEYSAEVRCAYKQQQQRQFPQSPLDRVEPHNGNL